MSDLPVFLPGLLCDAELWAARAQALSDLTRSWIADLTLDDTVAAMAARVGAR